MQNLKVSSDSCGAPLSLKQAETRGCSAFEKRVLLSVERVTKGCRKGAERVPKGCRKGAERVPRWCREGDKKVANKVTRGDEG